MKRIIIALALSTAATGLLAAAPVQDAEKAASQDAGSHLARMQEHLQQMQQQVARMQQTQDPQTRQQLMSEHMQTMHAHMQTMHAMQGMSPGGAGGGHHGGMMGGHHGGPAMGGMMHGQGRQDMMAQCMAMMNQQPGGAAAGKP